MHFCSSIHHQKRKDMSGFTLIELIVVIVITGILSTMLVGFITNPINTYIDVTRRAQMVNNADMALRHIQRDIRKALPNSIRTDNGSLMMINTVAGGRYRIAPPGDVLDFTQPDTSFDALGFIEPLIASSELRVAIYHLGVQGADAYQGDNVLSPAGASLSGDRVTFPSHQFPFSSPRQRFFLVDHVIRYRCENQRLYREICTISTSPTCSVSEPVATSLNCGLTLFNYEPGTATRSGIVTIQVALEETGERINLMHQVHVSNAP